MLVSILLVAFATSPPPAIEVGELPRLDFEPLAALPGGDEPIPAALGDRPKAVAAIEERLRSCAREHDFPFFDDVQISIRAHAVADRAGHVQVTRAQIVESILEEGSTAPVAQTVLTDGPVIDCLRRESPVLEPDVPRRFLVVFELHHQGYRHESWFHRYRSALFSPVALVLLPAELMMSRRFEVDLSEPRCAAQATCLAGCACLPVSVPVACAATTCLCGSALVDALLSPAKTVGDVKSIPGSAAEAMAPPQLKLDAQAEAFGRGKRWVKRRRTPSAADHWELVPRGALGDRQGYSQPELKPVVEVKVASSARGQVSFAGQEAGLEPGLRNRIQGALQQKHPALFKPDGTLKDLSAHLEVIVEPQGAVYLRPTDVRGDAVVSDVLLVQVHRIAFPRAPKAYPVTLDVKVRYEPGPSLRY